MTARLYLDGCSLTYGQGLDRQHSLGYLFENLGGYIVKDESRPGKSNIAIAYDAYLHANDYDVFVLGFTYSSRFGLKYKDKNLDFYSGHHGNGFDLEPDNLDQSHSMIQKYFYSVFESPYCDNLSDMLFDTTISYLKQQNKKVLGFSWQERTTVNKIFYPFIGLDERLPDGHLDKNGTKRLYNLLGEQLGAE